MYPALPEPKLVGGLAALAAAANEPRFLALALPHNLAAELGSPQIAAAYQDGTFPAVKWLADADSIASRQLADLRMVISKSTMVTSGIAAVVVMTLSVTGKIHPSLPVDIGKIVTAMGAITAGWASVLQFHPVTPTFRGNFLHEVAHITAVRVFFASGLALGALGALWW